MLGFSSSIIGNIKSEYQRLTNKHIFHITRLGSGCTITCVLDLIACAMYYLFCVYIILDYFSWDFKMLFSENALIKTKTYWPVIIQVILYALIWLVKMMMVTAYHSTTESYSHVQGNHSQEVRNVIIKDYGQKKLEVVKYVKEATGFSLEEAVNIVQNKGIIENLPIERAEKLIQTLNSIGASAEIIYT